MIRDILDLFMRSSLIRSRLRQDFGAVTTAVPNYAKAFATGCGRE